MFADIIYNPNSCGQHFFKWVHTCNILKAEVVAFLKGMFRDVKSSTCLCAVLFSRKNKLFWIRALDISPKLSRIFLLNFIIQGGIFRKRVLFLGYRRVSPKHTEQHSLAKSMVTLLQSQSDTSSCEVWRTRTAIQGVESWKTAQYAFAKSPVEPN